MHVYYIDKIIQSNDNEKMEQLKKMLVDTIFYLKGTDYDKYEELECKLYEIVEGKKLTEEKATKWVESMNPPAKWTMEDIKTVKEKYGIDIPLTDFYVLMNMMYSDYHNAIGEDLDKYIQLSKDWYFDDDVKMDGSQKLYCYYKHIIKG